MQWGCQARIIEICEQLRLEPAILRRFMSASTRAATPPASLVLEALPETFSALMTPVPRP